MRVNQQKWLRLGWLVPLVWLGHAGFAETRSAEACSGGAGPVGWDDVAVDSTEKQVVPIATDGLVVLHGYYFDGDVDPAAPGVWVRATNDAGDSVPGKLRVAHTTDSSVYLTWQADHALSIGDELQLSWSTHEPTSASTELAQARHMDLEVVSEPTVLPTPEALLGDWGDLRHGVGDLVSCTASNSCGVEDLQVPTREVRGVGVRTSWKLPEISGMVAWLAWAEPSKPADAFDDFGVQPVLISGGHRGSTNTGIAAFRQHASEHCAVLVVKDLRTNEERRSASVCDDAKEPTFVRRDHDLTECDDAPTLESLPLWCEGRVHEPRCKDIPPIGDGGAGGQPSVIEPEPSAGAGGDDQPSKGDDGDTNESIQASGGGCQLAPAGDGVVGALAALGALGTLGTLVRRRRTAR